MHRQQGFAGENVSAGPTMNFSSRPIDEAPPPGLTEEEMDDLRIELLKTEDEIQTLRQVLLAKEKYASDIKRQLGLSPLSNLKQNLSKGWQDVQTSTPYITASATLDDISRSDAYKRTQETFSHVGQVTTAALSSVGVALTRRLAEMSLVLSSSSGLSLVNDKGTLQDNSSSCVGALPLPSPPRHAISVPTMRHSSTFKSFEEMVGGVREKVTGGGGANTAGFYMS